MARDMTTNISLQLLVTLVSLACLVNISLGGRDEPTSCDKTKDPESCHAKGLSVSNKAQAGPRVTVRNALNAALTAAKSASASLSSASPDCKAEMSSSQESLSKSIAEVDKINASNAAMSVSNIKTWVSAALTSQTTCSDGLTQPAAKAQIQKVIQLTKSALALVNSNSSGLV
ncbi:hypothetical protein GQ457_08G001260 [Hibiscus cannabinus]